MQFLQGWIRTSEESTLLRQLREPFQNFIFELEYTYRENTNEQRQSDKGVSGKQVLLSNCDQGFGEDGSIADIRKVAC
jgi:uncharacterized protein YggL (DUF469 family)